MSFKLGCRTMKRRNRRLLLRPEVYISSIQHQRLYLGLTDFLFFSFYPTLVFSDQVTLETFRLFTASYGIMDRSSSRTGPRKIRISEIDRPAPQTCIFVHDTLPSCGSNRFTSFNYDFTFLV